MKTKRMTGIAFLIAISAVLTVLSNYIVIGGISINLSLIPIAIAGMLYGPIAGLFVGLANGMIVMAAPSTAAFFSVSVVGTLIICLTKTSIAGFVSGLIYKALKNKNEGVAIILSSLVVPVINTSLFIIYSLIFFGSVFKELISIFVSLNFVIEFTLTILLSYPIKRIVHLGQK